MRMRILSIVQAVVQYRGVICLLRLNIYNYFFIPPKFHHFYKQKVIQPSPFQEKLHICFFHKLLIFYGKTNGSIQNHITFFEQKNHFQVFRVFSLQETVKKIQWKTLKKRSIFILRKYFMALCQCLYNTALCLHALVFHVARIYAVTSVAGNLCIGSASYAWR